MQEANRKALGAVRAASQQLLDSGHTSHDFFRRLLPRLVSDARLQAAAVWMFDDHSRLRLVAEHELSSLSNTGQFFVDQEHQAAVGSAMKETRVRVLANRNADGGEVKPHSLAIGPIVQGDRGVGAIEVFRQPHEDDDEPTFLEELADLLAGYGSKAMNSKEPIEAAPGSPSEAQSETPRAPEQTPEFWKQFDHFVLSLRRLEVAAVAMNAVNDGRVLLGCDRISLGVKHGRGLRMAAVSGQQEIHPRSNLVRAMTALARVAVQSGVPFVYQGEADELPPQLEEPLADYLAESRMRMVAIFPLVDDRGMQKDEDDVVIARRQRPAAIGCLIVEQATESVPQPGLLQRTEFIVPHIASAIADAERHESIFLLPLWRVLGRTLRWFRGRRLAVAVAISIAIGALGAGLAFVPWMYRVEATGQAMPVLRNDIFAPDDGDVIEVPARGGAAVKTGDPLVVLRNNSLHAEVVATRSAVGEKTKLAASLNLQAEDASAHGATDDAVKLRGEELRTRTEVDGLQEQLKVLEEREARLTIRAPADGTVATFQPEELLKGRPVRRGERLLEVMNEQGPWRLELEVPEHRMGHVLGALSRAADHNLRIEYIPATAVELTLPATLRVEDVGTRTEISEKEGSVVVVQAEINPDLLPGRRIGAEVIAKIECGERSLFYVLFGDVVEFVQRHVWW